MSSIVKTTGTDKRKGTKMKVETFLPEDYKPVETEPFMNENQLEYFRVKLLTWKADLLEDSRDTVAGMKDQTRNIPDVADRASEANLAIVRSRASRFR